MCCLTLQSKKAMQSPTTALISGTCPLSPSDLPWPWWSMAYTAYPSFAMWMHVSCPTAQRPRHIRGTYTPLRESPSPAARSGITAAIHASPQRMSRRAWHKAPKARTSRRYSSHLHRRRDVAPAPWLPRPQNLRLLHTTPSTTLVNSSTHFNSLERSDDGNNPIVATEQSFSAQSCELPVAVTSEKLEIWSLEVTAGI